MIVSTTLTGNSEEHIAGALESLVYWVDACIVIDTGVTDRTLEVAREVAGDKLIVRQFPWCDDFGAARNFALQTAEEAGADWAWTLDTDERMLFKAAWSNKELETNGDLWVLFTDYVDNSYAKERIIRLNRGVHWQGVTHECVATLPSDEHRALTVNLSFSELPKTPRQMFLKNRRDAQILTEYVKVDPDNPRWWVYLGMTLQLLERYEEALPPLREAMRLAGVDNEGQLAVYRLLACYGKLRRWGDALRLCDIALLLCPGDADFCRYLDAAKRTLCKELAREAAIPTQP